MQKRAGPTIHRPFPNSWMRICTANCLFTMELMIVPRICGGIAPSSCIKGQWGLCLPRHHQAIPSSVSQHSASKAIPEKKDMNGESKFQNKTKTPARILLASRHREHRSFPPHAIDMDRSAVKLLGRLGQFNAVQRCVSIVGIEFVDTHRLRDLGNNLVPCICSSS